MLWDYEQQQPAVGQVAGRVRQEGVFHPFVFLVPIIGRIKKQYAEGVVGDGGGEEVAGQGAVQAVGRLLRPVLMQLHPAGLDGPGASVAEQAGELGQGFASPAAGVQDAQGVGAAGAAPGPVEQLGNQVNDPGRRRVVSPFSLCS